LVFTQKKLRQTDHTIAGLNFKTKTVLPLRFFGLKKIWSNTTQIQIADIHKTIIDILDDPAIGGGGVHSIEIFRAYMQAKDANWDILIKYAQQLNHGAVYKRLGLLMDNFLKTEKEQTEKLHNQIKKGVINFDPSTSLKGPIHTKWGIRLNVPLNDI
jgi:predicted transcriptional regulator of viral defense system